MWAAFDNDYRANLLFNKSYPSSVEFVIDLSITLFESGFLIITGSFSGRVIGRQLCKFGKYGLPLVIIAVFILLYLLSAGVSFLYFGVFGYYGYQEFTLSVLILGALSSLFTLIMISDDMLDMIRRIDSSRKEAQDKETKTRKRLIITELEKDNVLADNHFLFNCMGIVYAEIEENPQEAKKTMVFEWLRQIKRLPDVYIQAVSGGTGPIALDKGIRELGGLYPNLKMPRLLMVQPDQCDPMVQAWEQAERAGFPDGFEQDYPVLDNPQTAVPTLATGNPATYPIIAKLVKRSGGTFMRMQECKLAAYARLAAFERKVLLGPASAVCIAGFFESLKKGLIKDGECVLLNTGEGVRRAPDFVNEMIYTTKHVNSVDDCHPHTMAQYREQLWKAVE